MITPRQSFLALASATGALAVASMWLPWFQSGSAGRNSFAAFRAAQILGIEWITPFRIFWFLIPVILLMAVASWLNRWLIPAALLLMFLGLVLALSGGAFWFLQGLQVGSGAATIAGVSTIVLSVPAMRSGPASPGS